MSSIHRQSSLLHRSHTPSPASAEAPEFHSHTPFSGAHNIRPVTTSILEVGVARHLVGLAPAVLGPVLALAVVAIAISVSERASEPSIASSAGILAALITIAFPWPQLVRGIKLRTAEGVSGSSWLMMFFAMSGWALYGVEHSDRYQQISAALTLPAVCGVLFIIHRSHGISVKQAGLTVAALSLGVATVALGGEIGSAVVVIGTCLLVGSTALASVMTSIPVGFSSATLNISSLAQAAWLLHSCLFGKWIVAAHAVLVIVFNAAVIFAAQQQLRRQPQRVLTLVN
ncbi:MAG: hypothetical protein ACPG1B_10045 [Ilumatobacteraceae bacterium]